MKCPHCHKDTGVRTTAQNKALWVFFELLAKSLNEAGLEVKKVMRPEYSIWWNKNMVHDLLWVPIQKILFKSSSTVELTKLEQINAIHELLMRELGEKHSIEYIPFPSGNTINGKIIGKNYTL